MVVCPAAAERAPTPSVDYEVSYDVRHNPTEAPSRVLVRHSGGWVRGESSLEGLGLRVTTFEREGYVGVIFIVEAGGARTAFRVASMAGDPLHDGMGKDGTRVGKSEVGGERCDLWRMEPEVPTAKQRLVACITADGILLHAATLDTPPMAIARAMGLQRRPQNPAFFSMPAGMVLKDVPDLAALERESEAWAKSIVERQRRR